LSRRQETPADHLAKAAPARERIDAADLTGRAKRIAKILIDWSFGWGRCSVWALQKHIARRAQVDETDVADMLEELQKRGWLAVRGRKGAPRLYTILPTGAGLVEVEPVALLDPREAAAIDAEVRALNSCGPGMEPAGEASSQRLLRLRLLEDEYADDLARVSRDRLALVDPRATQLATAVATEPQSNRGDERAMRLQIEQSLRAAGWSNEDIDASRSLAIDTLATAARQLPILAESRVGETPSQPFDLVKHQVGGTPSRGPELVKHQVDGVSPPISTRAGAPGESLSFEAIRSNRSESVREWSEEPDSPEYKRRFNDEEKQAVWEDVQQLDVHGELVRTGPESNRGTWIKRVKTWPTWILRRAIEIMEEERRRGKRHHSPLAYLASKAKTVAKRAGQTLKVLFF
jgi:hypothetical protein